MILSSPAIVKQVEVEAYRIPTDQPEEDGTFHWESTTLVLVEVTAENGARGLGFSYASTASAALIRDLLADRVIGLRVEDTGAAWQRMVRSVRNAGRPGVASHAISAVDIALWDLKARLSKQALFHLLGPYRDGVPVYGSGGFTNYSETRLAEQLGAWVASGIPRVKMKIGKDWGSRPQEDLQRVRIARDAIGPQAELFVDANGAYTAKQAIDLAQKFAELGVTYFEEPVAFDFLAQLAFIRQRIPMDLAAGEYGYDIYDFRNVLLEQAVDVLQADVTRCLGVTGWLQAAQLAYSFGIPFSAHTAPSIHAQVGCIAPQIAHVEYFYDHARIEQLLFDGAPVPKNGVLYPDPSRPGLGLEFKRQDAQVWRIDF